VLAQQLLERLAKKKWPKYKKVMESDITIKDGKLGLKEKKKK
jgi:hypothetical protein